VINLDLLKEVAAMAGYTITGSSGADPTNKTRAQRRVNIVKADIISRFGGRWPSQYREGWLPLLPLINTGTLTATLNSNTVTGFGTTWSSGTPAVAEGYKIMMPDGAYYKIASVQSDTQLTLTQPYQAATLSGKTYQIWKDEYTLYPEVLSIGGFLDYQLQGTMSEAWPRNMKDSYPVPVNVELPNVYTIIGRKSLEGPYSTGTVTGTVNMNTLTGVGTAWLANIKPGYEITINSVVYHVKKVFSDTSIELYQFLTYSPSSAVYSSQGKNSLIVRFREPTSQRIVHYWYWAKAYPLVNDNDEDWVCEMYPEVINLGAVVKDYLDKNDVARANMSKITFENAVKDMKVSEDNAMVGVRTLGYDIPSEARD
jgi:hypothetical protein